MATATLLSGPTTDTGNTPNSSGSFTPTLNDLLVVIVTKEASALSSPIVSADLSCSAGTTFTLVRTQGFGASAHQLAVFVANAKSAASSQTVTLASGADAGGGTIIAVYGIAGMTFTGSSAIRQSGGETDQASGEVPSVNFATGVALTGNLIIGTVGVVDNTPGLLAPASFQAVSEAGYTTGATQGISNTYRNSGHTSQTVAWQTNTTGGSYATIIVELDTSTGTSYTDRRLGQIDLTGTRRETHRYTDRRSGQVDATGVRRESNSRTNKPTGQITLSGTVSEDYLVPVTYTDKPSGTISILGSRRESLSHTDTFGGAGGATYAETILSDSPEVYWRLGEASGPTAEDATANNRDGTITGATLGVAGALTGDSNTAASFTTDDFIISSSYIFNHATATIEAWVKIAGAPAHAQLIVGCRYGDNVVDKVLYVESDGKLYFYVYDTDIAGGRTTSTPSVTIPTGEWVHVVGVADGSEARAYQNGVEVGSVACGNTYVAYGGPNVCVAAYTTVAVPGGLNYLDGSVDEVAFYAGDIGATQVGVHYDIGHDGPSGGSAALITLSGSAWSQVQNRDKCSGTITLSGSVREQNSRTSKTTGTILLSGQATDSHAISSTDRTTGTISISGTVSESWSTAAPVTNTDSPTGQITLSGSVRESWALGYTDRRSGQIDVSGTRRELSRQTPKPTGTILVSGTVSDQYVGATTDRVVGTITLSGATRESHAVSRTEKVIGTVQISGSLTDSFQISGGTQTVTPTGTIQILGTRRESQRQSVKTTGTINISGQVRETFTGPSFSDSVTGTVSLAGTWRESNSRRVLRTGTITVTGTVSEQNLGATTDRRSGQITLSGTQSDYWESTRIERRSGQIVLSGQVWENYLPSGVTIDKRTGSIVLSGSALDIHSRWDFVDGERWPGSTEDRWQEDVGERWNLDPVA